MLPVLLAKLHASDTVVGLARLVQTLGFTLPALFAAHYIHGRSNHKSFLLWACVVGRSGVLTLPPLFLFCAASRPGLTLAWFFAVYAFFWLFDGGCAVSWFDIIAKTVPARVRGRFFGTMQMAGGLAAIGAGCVVRLAFQRWSFPTDFAVLAACWCGGLVLSQICLTLIREPSGSVEEEEEKPGFAAYLRQAVPMLRSNPHLACLMGVRLLLDGAGMAMPFYVLFARRDLHVRLATVGLYAILQSIGKVCTGPVWGWLSDRFGTTVGLRSVGTAIVLIPALALAAARGASGAFPAVFFLLGAVQDGLWMVGSNALLEAVEARERPLAVGVSNVFQMPGALYGVLGGLLAQSTSYPTVFTGACICGILGLLLSFRLPSRQPSRLPPVIRSPD